MSIDLIALIALAGGAIYWAGSIASKMDEIIKLLEIHTQLFAKNELRIDDHEKRIVELERDEK